MRFRYRDHGLVDGAGIFPEARVDLQVEKGAARGIDGDNLTGETALDQIGEDVVADLARLTFPGKKRCSSMMVLVLW